MPRHFRWIPIFVSIIFASLYIYPIFFGLILLPLDLLVSNSNPWLYASTILLKNSYMQDSIIQMFPWRHLTFSSLTGGILPLWNPYQFMGVPFMAGMKPLVFYPGNLLFLFGEMRSWNILLWLQLFLSLWFTYLFVRLLGAGRLSSFLSSIAFAFCSLMIGVLEFGSEGHVLLWLPLILYLVKRFIDSENKWFLVGISLSAACSVFAGHLQFFAYIIALTAAFTLFETYGKTKCLAQLILIMASLVLGVGISAIQIVPAIELFFQSYRGLGNSYAVFTNGLLKPYSFFRLLSPDWFGNPISHDLHGGYIEASGYFGIVPLFFTFYAVWYERKQKYVRFFSLAGLIALLFSMDKIAQLIFMSHIPLVTSGYGGRLFVITLFSGAILSAFGLQSFAEEKNRSKRIWALLVFVVITGLCFFIGLIAKKWGAVYAVTFSNIKIQIVSVVLLAALGISYSFILRPKRYAKILFIILVILLTYADLFRMGYRFLTFSNTKFLYPETPAVSFVRSYTKNSLGRVYGLSEPEIYSLFQIASPETYNPLYPLRTATLLQALEGTLGQTLPTNKYYLTQNPRLKYVLDFLGTDIIVVRKGYNPALEYWHNSVFQTALKKIYEDDGQDVYQSTSAYPRYGLVYDVQSGVADADALRLIEDQGVDFRKTVLIREPLSEHFIQGTGSAQLIAFGLNSMTFRVESDKPGIFYLSDAYFPGWHATVNGENTSILLANYAFRAVVIPKGTSTVYFWYMPNSFIAGVIMSALSFACLIGIVVGLLVRKKT